MYTYTHACKHAFGDKSAVSNRLLSHHRYHSEISFSVTYSEIMQNHSSFHLYFARMPQ